MLAYASDLAAMEEAVGHDVIDLAGLGAQDAGEVSGLIAGEACSGRGPGVGDEATTGHAFEFRAESMMYLAVGRKTKRRNTGVTSFRMMTQTERTRYNHL